MRHNSYCWKENGGCRGVWTRPVFPSLVAHSLLSRARNLLPRADPQPSQTVSPWWSRPRLLARLSTACTGDATRGGSWARPRPSRSTRPGWNGVRPHCSSIPFGLWVGSLAAPTLSHLPRFLCYFQLPGTMSSQLPGVGLQLGWPHLASTKSPSRSTAQNPEAKRRARMTHTWPGPRRLITPWGNRIMLQLCLQGAEGTSGEAEAQPPPAPPVTRPHSQDEAREKTSASDISWDPAQHKCGRGD